MRQSGRTFGVLAALIGLTAGHAAQAVTPESPEVRQLVAEGLEVLEQPVQPNTDRYAEQLGGKCLVGLAFVKANKPDHPRVEEAVDACRASMASSDGIDVYSNGLAIVFLCELGPQRYRREIQWYLDFLRRRQKAHGGWGYDGNNLERSEYTTGDTSQTQYGAIAYWTAFRHGFRIDPDSLERAADWLLRTQGPNGCWGYQGTIAQGSQRVSQFEMGNSMLAAGLGGMLICADLLNAVLPSDLAEDDFADEEGDSTGDLPAVLRIAVGGRDAQGPTPTKIQPTRIDTVDLLESIDLARGWMDKNYAIDIGKYTYYYLYSTERYQSFYELLEGVSDEEPKWYNDGYAFLLTNKHDGIGWQGGCGKRVDTAFSILFLLRSTQKSIRGTLGEGRLMSGRGLPADVARAKMRGNEIIVEQVQTKIDELLSMIDDSDQSRLDALARDPTNLVVQKVDQRSARRLEQLVRGGEPEVRLLAVRALGRTGNLDYVPSLIYALTDPERRIVLEARDGLRFMSRRFERFSPPDDFTDRQRYEAVDAWKSWYKSLRPDALLEQ
jgi:hypothetical protein